MICLSKNKEGPEILIEHFAGSLDPIRSAELDRHAKECAECRGLMAVWDTLDASEVPAVSSDFDARLYARMAQEERKPWWRRVLGRPLVPLAAGGIVLAMALMVVGPDALDTPKQTRVDPEMEQVEQTLADLELLTPLATVQVNAPPAERN